MLTPEELKTLMAWAFVAGLFAGSTTFLFKATDKPRNALIAFVVAVLLVLVGGYALMTGGK